MIHGFSRSFSFRISLIIVIIIFFSLLLNSFLNFFNFEKTYKDLISSRFIVAERDIKNTIEYQLGLGLYLHELKNIQTLINEIKSRDSGISSIFIFDEDGVVLFSTDTKKSASRIDRVILTRIKNLPRSKTGEDEKPVTVMHRGSGIIILPIINSYGMRAGSIAIAYPEHIVTTPVNKILAYLSTTFVVLFLVFSVITLLIIRILSKNISRGFIMMKSSLDDLISGRKNIYTPPGSNRRMEEVFTGFRNTSEKALKEIREAKAEIDSI